MRDGGLSAIARRKSFSASSSVWSGNPCIKSSVKAAAQAHLPVLLPARLCDRANTAKTFQLRLITQKPLYANGDPVYAGALDSR